MLSSLSVANFEINLAFLIKPFSCITKKSGNNVIISRTEKALTWSQMYFSSFLKGFQLSEIVSDMKVGLSIMKTTTNTEKSWQCNIRFSLIVEQILASCRYSPQALIWLGKLRMCLQISNELIMMFYVIGNPHSNR